MTPSFCVKSPNIRNCNERNRDCQNMIRFCSKASESFGGMGADEDWASSGLTDIHQQAHSPEACPKSMEREMFRPRRSFKPEFKTEIVACCQRGDRSIGQVARAFNSVKRRLGPG
jgi:hypothetical protein